MNYPGSWHDSKLDACSELNSKYLTDKYLPAVFALLADSAFLRTAKEFVGKIARARKDYEMGPGSDVPKSVYLAAIDTVLSNMLPSERQSAE